MKAFSLTLRVLAAVIALFALLHGLLGHGAESLLGIPVPEAAAADASQDSQNRFFGLAFGLYAAVLWLVAGDVDRYFDLFEVALAVFFVAALGRVVSLLFHGLPAVPVLVLTALELLAPPLLLVWGWRVVEED